MSNKRFVKYDRPDLSVEWPNETQIFGVTKDAQGNLYTVPSEYITTTYIDTGLILTSNFTDSDDKLSRTLVMEFRDQVAFDQFDTDSVIGDYLIGRNQEFNTLDILFSSGWVTDQ